METKKMKTLDMVYIALFACLMAICAWISIPGQIPFTLQTMGVFLAVGLLGASGAPSPCWCISSWAPWACRYSPALPAAWASSWA